MDNLPVSKQYRYTVSELQKERLQHRITEQDLSLRLDEAAKEEVERQEHLGPSLVRQALANVEKDILENEKKAFEEQARQEKLALNQQRQRDINDQKELLRKEREEKRDRERKEQEEKKAWEAEQATKEIERISFREVARSGITEHNVRAMRLQRQYNVLQVILLVFSAVTATMAGIDGVARWVVAVTGVIATIAGGMLTTFKIQDRIYANHKAVAELSLECQKYDYHIEEYKCISPEEAFIRFSRAINIIQGEQMLQEVELWNPNRDENKKALSEAKIDKQEEKDSEKIQDVEIPEEYELVDLLAETGENDEEQYKDVSSSLDIGQKNQE